jgi:hypothetical protein
LPVFLGLKKVLEGDRCNSDVFKTKGVMVCACSPTTQEVEVRGLQVQSQSQLSVRPWLNKGAQNQNNKQAKKQNKEKSKN